MKIELENVKPAEIEKRSFEIITEELGDTHLIPGTEPIVKRCIHTSADFDYAKNLMFSEGAVEKALDAIRNGAVIVTLSLIHICGDFCILPERSASGFNLHWKLSGVISFLPENA